MFVLALANNKGGVGKTASAVNLAHEFSTTHGLRTLLIDLDPQANATLDTIGGGAAYSFADVLSGAVTFSDALQNLTPSRSYVTSVMMMTTACSLRFARRR